MPPALSYLRFEKVPGTKRNHRKVNRTKNQTTDIFFESNHSLVLMILNILFKNRCFSIHNSQKLWNFFWNSCSISTFWKTMTRQKKNAYRFVSADITRPCCGTYPQIMRARLYDYKYGRKLLTTGAIKIPYKTAHISQ